MLLALYSLTCALEPKVLTHWKLMKADLCSSSLSDLVTGVGI